MIEGLFLVFCLFGPEVCYSYQIFWYVCEAKAGQWLKCHMGSSFCMGHAVKFGCFLISSALGKSRNLLLPGSFFREPFYIITVSSVLGIRKVQCSRKMRPG